MANQTTPAQEAEARNLLNDSPDSDLDRIDSTDTHIPKDKVESEKFTNDTKDFLAVSTAEDYDGSKNPLHQFRSYSYKFILYATANVADADKLGSITSTQDQTNQIFGRGATIDSDDAENYYGKYDIKTSPEGIRYVTILNTFEDADMGLDNVEYNSNVSSLNLTNEVSSKIDLNQSGSEMSLDIFEAYGCRLLDIFVRANSELGVATSVFGLKIYFIGHTDQQTLTGASTQIVTGPGDIGYFYSLKPIIFQIMTCQMTMTTTGSAYRLTTLIMANTSNPVLGLNVNSSVNVTDKNPTLEKVCNDYLTSINTMAEKQRKDLEREGRTKLTPVIYKVNFIDNFFDSNDTSVIKRHIKDSIVANVTTAQQNDGSGIIVQPPSHMNMSGKISFIVKLCPELTNKLESKEAFFSYTISESTETSDTQITTIINVIRRKVDKITNNDPQETAMNAYNQGRLLHYKYYFSGQNVDIIKYDIKVEFGWNAVTSFQVTGPAVPKQQPVDLYAAYVESDVNAPSEKNKSSLPSLQEVAMGGIVGNTSNKKTEYTVPHQGVQTTASVSRTLSDPISHARFSEHMKKHLSGETSNALCQLEIWGNPQLLQSTIMIPSELNESSMKKSEDSVELDAKQAIISTNLLVKVDVYTPSRSWLSSFSTKAVPELTFNEDFWHGGLFTLMGIKSKFNRGKFSQDLTLSRVPYDESLTKQTETSKPENNKKNKKDVGLGVGGVKMAAGSGGTGSNPIGNIYSKFNSPVDLNVRISKYYTLADLSTKPRVSSYAIPQQKQIGIRIYSDTEIAEHLAKLATTVLDPIRDQYPNVLINSGFRNKGIGPSGKISDHEIGFAADIVIPGVGTELVNITNWIQNYLPISQLILEWNGGERWIHISVGSPKTGNLRIGTAINGNYTWGRIFYPT